LPSAFFVANDIMALGALDALRNQGIQVPGQVKVIGFDNIGMSSWPVYELTTWEQPIEEMVEKTVTYLLSEIVEYTGLADAIEIEGLLIKRETA
jgi:DNA-binding LacI/PurR family transcriptional regulator